MKERLGSSVSLLLLAVLVLGTWWAAELAQRAVPEDAPRRMTHEIDSFVEEFVMVRSDPQGVPSSRLEGKRMEHFPDDDSSDIVSPRSFSQKPGRQVTVATAKTGRMDEDGARIVMTGDARFVREAGMGQERLDITSDVITLRPDDDVAFTDLPAVILNGRSRINGNGMHYNNVTRELQVASRNRVEIAPRVPPVVTPAPARPRSAP